MESSTLQPTLQDDRIYTVTRIVSAIVVPFLVLAFIILYITPDQSGERFAWEIRPHLQAMFVGAGYIGGSYLFVRTIFGKQWHRVSNGFLPVITFTLSMLLATILHWERFDLSHFPFQIWLILYVVTPFLISWLWWNNRGTDPGELEADDILVPRFIARMMNGVGLVVLIFAFIGFVLPNLFIDIWVWTLTPLTARLIGGWLALLATGGLVSARERRWSGWRIGLESILIWHILVLLAAVLNPGDFKSGSLLNWYVVSVTLMVVTMIGLYAWMERQRMRQMASE